MDPKKKPVYIKFVVFCVDDWAVRVYVNGKYNEERTYYACDEEDARETMKVMEAEVISHGHEFDPVELLDRRRPGKS